MKRKILTVEATFKITGRGLIIVGEFDFNSVTIKGGTTIVIIRPDGKALSLEFKGFDLISRRDRSAPPKHLSFSVGDVNEEDVPVGSEVFIEE